MTDLLTNSVFRDWRNRSLDAIRKEINSCPNAAASNVEKVLVQAKIARVVCGAGFIGSVFSAFGKGWCSSAGSSANDDLTSMGRKIEAIDRAFLNWCDVRGLAVSIAFLNCNPTGIMCNSAHKQLRMLLKQIQTFKYKLLIFDKAEQHLPQTFRDAYQEVVFVHLLISAMNSLSEERVGPLDEGTIKALKDYCMKSEGVEKMQALVRSVYPQHAYEAVMSAINQTG